MATGGRTPRADPTSAALADELAECKRLGQPWQVAWHRALARVPVPPAWSLHVPGEPERVLDFTERHLRAAYEGEEAGRYCQGDGCRELLPPGRKWCQRHRRMGLELMAA